MADSKQRSRRCSPREHRRPHHQNPGEKQDHLRALALLALTAGHGASRPTPTASSRGTDEPDVADVADAGNEWETFSTSLGNTVRRFGRPEVTVVIDTTALDPNGNPTADWGIPITIPWQRIQHLCRTAHVRPVIIHDGSVVDADADGDLNLERSARLANRAQQRALSAIYATCAVPGCNVSFTHTKPHHVHWWRHGGPTNLANLLPLCSHHHHCAHGRGWVLTLGPDRQLIIELPDGQIMRTGPPQRVRSA